MSEGIGTRVGRIVSGTVNMLVESMEQQAPEMVMEEAIREIDAAIGDVRHELGQVVARKYIATTRLTEQQQKTHELTENIEFAVKEMRDDLAEAAIAQQLDLEAQIPILETAIAEDGKREKELEGYIAALQGKKRDMRGDLKRFREAYAQKMANPTLVGSASSPGSGIDDKVARAESAFDQVLEKAAGLRGSSATSDSEVQTKVAELEALSRQHRIQERLAAIKKKPEA